MQEEQTITAEQVVDVCFDMFKFRDTAYGSTQMVELERKMDAASNLCTQYIMQQLAKASASLDYFG